MDAREKLKAKTGLAEIKVILGWLLNVRTMTIALPKNKFIAYSKAILNMVNRGWTLKGELEMNIGWWVHLGQIIPVIHYFLTRLCFLLWCLGKKRKVKFNEHCKADLHFLQFALKKCQDGVTLHAIAYRCPTHAYHSDSCPASLRGYSNVDVAWQFYVE